MSKYRTDDQMIDFLQRRITRLESTLERLETLGMTSVSSGGNQKTFRTQEDVRMELERAEREYQIITDRMQGTPTNPHIKEVVVCSRKQY